MYIDRVIVKSEAKTKLHNFRMRSTVQATVQITKDKLVRLFVAWKHSFLTAKVSE